MPSDIEIAQSARLQPIVEVARSRLGLDEEHLVPYGRYKAKLSLPFVQALHAGDRPPGRLVLVTAISPTPAGEGKTTTTVGLGDALNRIGARTAIALREPSLGPVFGVKGGAAGGGYAQVVPMEDINLHFTGDFGAVALAHNLLAACIDNHVHHGNALGIDVRRIGWRRVMDLNDRALRRITVGLGGPANGFPREEGFDIIAASEVMAILCLATSLADLKRRLGDIVVAETTDRRPVRARDLKVQGAMAVLLKDAIAPNLVQTLEGTPAFVHGGPFGNIAHGCNSVMATRTALRLADWVVTEAGFGSDLGAEKFIDIKCRSAGLAPCAGVVVATVRALKYHGGVELPDLGREDVAAVARGSANLERHVRLVRDVYGLPCAVALNHFVQDAPAEIEWLQRWGAERGVPVVLARHWAEGGKGAEALAHEVVRLGSGPRPAASAAAPTSAGQSFVYDLQAPLADKLRAIAQRVYGAADIALPEDVRRRLDELERQGYGGLPVCVAKTQYSFSADPRLRGAATGHVLPVREVRLAAGAGFVVMVCGDIMTMPGLPKVSAAERIDIGDDGRIVGLD